MTIQDIAREIMTVAYEINMESSNQLIMSKVICKRIVSSYKEPELAAAFNYLDDKKYVEATFGGTSKLPLYITLKSAGIDWISEISQEKSSSVQQVFNIEKNYGAVGTNTSFTINNTIDFEEFSNLINANTEAGSVDRRQLEELKTLLQEHLEQGKPLENSFLASFSTSVQKHAWIASPIATLLLKSIITGQP